MIDQDFESWKSDHGFRRLKGKERELFLQGAAYLCDILKDGAKYGNDWFETGVRVFDGIPLEERPYALLAAVEPLVGKAPLNRKEVYAWNEGAVLAVFYSIERFVETEIAHHQSDPYAPDPTFWRRRIRDAWRDRFLDPDVESNGGDDDPYADQPADSLDLGDWKNKLSELTDEILQDRDCEDADELMDADVGVARDLKRELGIERDYYTALPPALTPKEKARLDRFYKRLEKESYGGASSGC